mgnify:CR=1 FL=1
MRKKMTERQIEKLAYEIRNFLLKHDLWMDVTIYFNGKAISTDDRCGHYAYNDPTKLFVLENQDPKRFFEYAGGIISMSFEGGLYEVMNYCSRPKVLNAFEKLLAKYGLHYELGNAWNLSVYPNVAF